MKAQATLPKHILRTAFAVLALVTVLAAGCRNKATQPPERSDQQIANDIQAKIQGETALAKQEIQVSVADGVATLSGIVDNDASRALAGIDSGTVPGVKTVVNNLTVHPEEYTAAPLSTPQQQPQPRQPRRTRQQQGSVTPPQPPTQMAPYSPVQAQAPTPPPQPPQPVVRQIVIPAGTVVPIRMAETLDSKTTQTNDVFHATLASDLLSEGLVAIPRGTPVLGRVVDAKEAAHFKGNALLTIELTQLTAHGHKISLTTDSYSTQGAARGKDTAVKTGGGAVVGALIGALAGGGEGAAIGALAGGGAGAGVNAVTRGKQVQIPTESIVNFHLQSPLTVTVTLTPSGAVQNEQNPEPQLLRRQGAP